MRDLYAKIPGAPNFRYYEFVRSATAIRLNIDNIPPEEYIWTNIERLASKVIQPIRNEFGKIRIESGYRCPKLNSKVGGSLVSNHCKGEAADIEPMEDGVGLIDLFNFIHEKLTFRWLIAEYLPSGWIHIDYREGSNINGVKIKDNKHDFLIVTPQYVNKLYNSNK